jgi:hypothetical protein
MESAIFIRIDSHNALFPTPHVFTLGNGNFLIKLAVVVL